MDVKELNLEKDFSVGKGLPLYIYKWVNYEYWPWWMLYTFVLPYYLYLSAKARNIFFFSNVNPSIMHGGFKNYDKLKVQELIPSHYVPYSLRVEPNKPVSSRLKDVILPVIAKPINGERGRLIKILHSKNELDNFINKIDESYIIQEFIQASNEATILWVNHPRKGKMITSFTTKEFLKVVGSGKDTVKQLLLKNPRFALQLKRLEKEISLETILPKDQKLIIEQIGNHCRGTRFINSNHLIDQRLIEVFSNISDQIPDLHYGRYDFKYNTMEELYQGHHIKILELNGVSSDPVHIFDQKTGLLQSIKDICIHLQILYDISVGNLLKGNKRASVLEVVKAMRSPSV